MHTRGVRYSKPYTGHTCRLSAAPAWSAAVVSFRSAKPMASLVSARARAGARVRIRARVRVGARVRVRVGVRVRVEVGVRVRVRVRIVQWRWG